MSCDTKRDSMATLHVIAGGIIGFRFERSAGDLIFMTSRVVHRSMSFLVKHFVCILFNAAHSCVVGNDCTLAMFAGSAAALTIP